MSMTQPVYGEIGFSEEQADLLEVAQNFCREKSPIDKVRLLMESEFGFDQSVWDEIVELGWLGIAVQEDYDGVGLSLAEVAPVMEEMGRRMMATPFLSTTLAAQVISVGGTEAQKKEALPKIVSGAVATVAVMEDEGAWDLAKPACAATAKGEGYVLSGVKHLVTDAAVADWFVISASCDGALGLFLLSKDDVPADRLTREVVIDETKRSFALDLEGLTIGHDMRLDADRAVAAMQHYQLAASLLSAAECVGGTIAVLDYTVDYLQTRKQFGKTIGSYQALKHPTVDAFINYEQARSHLYSAAHSFNDQGAGEIATRMARAQADQAFSHAADRAIQFHGGFGFTYDCDAQLYRRRAAFHAALYGDAAYHRKKLGDLLF